MKESFQHTFTRYLVALAACIVVAVVCVEVERGIGYAPMESLVLTIASFCALMLAVVLTLLVFVMHREAADWDNSCEPLLSDYEHDGDVDAFVAGYEDWRMGQHTAATRFALLEEMCRRLAVDGYAADAEVALSNLAAMARTPHLVRRFKKTRALCSKVANSAK